MFFFFFFKQKTAYEIMPSLVGSEMCIRDSFGTIKRQWGFDHILSKKGKKRASADVGFIFIAYNLKRILNLMGEKGLREFYNLSILCLKAFIQPCKNIFKPFDLNNAGNNYFCNNLNLRVKKLILVQ